MVPATLAEGYEDAAAVSRSLGILGVLEDAAAILEDAPIGLHNLVNSNIGFSAKSDIVPILWWSHLGHCRRY